MTESKMLKIPFLVLVICGCGIPMVLYGFIPILSYAFRLKATLVLLLLFQLTKGEFQSSCPHISIESLDWLALTFSLSPKRSLLPVISFDPIVITNNKRCSVLVQFLSDDWSGVDMDIFLAAFLPNWVESGGVDILLR